jgi:hypothetical protein
MNTTSTWPTTTREAEAQPATMHTVARRQVHAAGERYALLKVEYGLHKIGEQAPYFSVTGEGWFGPRINRHNPDLAGAIHETVAAAFPKLADLIALHLSDVDGVPLHAEANGWYWYSDYDGKGIDHVPDNWRALTPVQRAEEYLRTPGHFPEGLNRETFAAHVDALRPVWKEQALAAIAAHNLAVPE